MAPKAKYCAGCLNKLTNKEYLSCFYCKELYDIVCANISQNVFMSMEKEAKDKWKCPSCKNKDKKGDNTNTPVSSKSVQHREGESVYRTTVNLESKDDTNITQRKAYHPVPYEPSSEYLLEPALLSAIRTEIHSSIEQSLKTTIEATIMKEFKLIKTELAVLNDLKSGVEFLSSEYDRMKLELDASNDKIKSLTNENVSLTGKVEELSNRLNLIEQHSRETNIEINGLPETKSENLMSVLKKLCSVTSVPIQDSDILSCSRVRKINDSNQRPRAVVIKLPTTRSRDEIIAGVVKFNKKNESNKLNSGHLGYNNAISPIYVSEHLSPYYKALHARTRKTAREKEYRYVWIRNGRIFVRKNDQSPAIQIKSYESLNRL